MRRGKGNPPSKWVDCLDDAVDDQDVMSVSDYEPSSVGGRSGLLWTCDGTCGERIGALEATLNRVTGMVEMLVKAGGLASLALRLAVEKHKGRMAQEWDESMSKASEKAKAEAVVKAVEKRARKRAEEEQRAEEARVQQE